MRNMNSISVVATGVRVTTTASTNANGAIPVDGAGLKPKYVRFAATGNCYVRLAPTVGLAVAVTTDVLLQVGAPIVMAVLGNTHYAVIDDGTSVKLSVTPLEDQ